MPIKSLSGAIAAIISMTMNPSRAPAEAIALAIGIDLPAVKAQPELSIVEHVTGRGKTIRGVIRADLTKEQAQAIDAYTFKKDGGWFIREKHLEAMAGVRVNPAAASVEQSVQKAPEQTEEQKQAIAQEQAAARQEQARMKSADRLRAVADKMLADAEAELGRDRNTNTARRARMAAGSIRAASKASGIAKTMHNLADAIAAGQAVKLGGMTSRTQVDLLETILYSAQHERINAKKDLSYQERERLRDEPFGIEDALYAKFPKMQLNTGGSLSATALAGKLTGIRGAKPLATKLYHGAEMTPAIAAELEKFLGKEQVARDLGWYNMEVIQRISRLERMGIKNLGDLTEALKEFIKFRDGGIKEDPVKAAERKLVGQKVGIDFFPTPKSLAQRMVELAGIEQGDRVLEPSAGSGNIADAAKAAGADVDTIEVSSQLRELLGLKGHNLIGHDFEVEDYTGRYYDAVLMNPPFSDRKDALHIMRAFDLLKKGGTLVAIAGEGVFFGSDAKAVGFREWLKEHRAHIEKLPEGTFLDKSLLATTGANARLIVMTRRTATGDVTSDDHLQDGNGTAASEPMTFKEFTDDSIPIPSEADAAALAIAKEVMGGRFEESNDDTTEMNKRAMAAGIPRMLTFVTDKTLGNRSLISIVADQNLRDAPTEKIQGRIDAITKKINQSMEKTVSDFDPSTLGGSGAAGRQRDRARASEARGIMGDYAKRLQDELDRRGVKPETESDAFTLAAQTEEELRAKEAADKAAQAKEEQERLAAERKAQADREAADFKLTGSDRPADIAMAAGQGDLFAPKTRGQKEAEKNLPKSDATISDADYAQVVEAARYLKDIVYSLDNLVGDDQRLLVALSSELGKSGRDTILMDAFGIDRNLAHTINNQLDDRKPHKLRAVDMDDAFDTFPMLKKIIDDAKEELRLRDERKAAKEAKNATLTDDMDPNSPNYRYRDTGYIADSRKEKAQDQIRASRAAGQMVGFQMIDWAAIEENPRAAKELITKSNLFGKVDWDALKAGGMTAEAGFLIDRIYASIGTEPGTDGPMGRKDYAIGIQSIRDRLEKCKTAEDVLNVLAEIRDEFQGTTLNADEAAQVNALRDESAVIRKKILALEAEHRALKDSLFEARRPLTDLQREQEKRARRGWKPDPEIAAKIAPAEAVYKDAEKALQEWEAAHPEIMDTYTSENGLRGSFRNPLKDEYRGYYQKIREIEEKAKKRNLLENQATRSWLSFGSKFFGVLNYRSARNGSDAFAGHVVNAMNNRVGGWDWAEKERAKPVKQATKEEVRFQLRVVDNYQRIGGRPVAAKSTQDLKDTFGFRDVQSGNWVLKDPASARFHVEQTAGAMDDMGDILGIPPSVLGLGGRLAMAFGARGSGAKGWKDSAPRAHYEPVQRVINLTKMGGGGCLGHEYFHALDNMLGELVNQKVSDKKDDMVTMNPDLLPPGKIRSAVSDLRMAMVSGTKRLPETFKITPRDRALAKANLERQYLGSFQKSIKDAGSAEAAVAVVRARYIGTDNKRMLKQRDDWIRIAVAYFTPGDKESVTLGTGPYGSDFQIGALELDAGQIGKYWSKPEEMAARAFQAYLEDRMADAGRRNDYLSAMADNKYHVDPLFGIEWKPFPEGEERKRINAAFDRLFEVIRGEQILEKAAANKPLMDAMFPGFDPDEELADIIRQMVA